MRDVGHEFNNPMMYFFACLVLYHVNDSENIPMPGGRLNKKDGLTWYGDSHVKDKTS